jgi:pilus assembly protein CpaE
MNVIAATPYDSFVSLLQRLHPGSVDCGHVWRQRLLVTDLPDLADEIAAAEPLVAVIGPGLYDEAALQLVELIDRARPDIVTVLVAEPSPELWRNAARVGARDVVSPDATDEELTDAIDRALQASDQRRIAWTAVAGPPPAGPRARIMSVFSPKGGAGKTTMSSNLAVGLALHSPGEVVLVDLDLQFGGADSALQLSTEHSIADACSLGAGLDAASLKMFLTPHQSGLFVLTAPEAISRADEVTPDQLHRILDLLSEHFRYIVVDTAAGIDVVTVAALERSTDLVLVSTTDVACVRALRRATDALDTVGINKHRRHFVFNRSDVKGGLALNDLRSVTGATNEVLVPEHRSVAIAMNSGSPILQSDPRSGPGKAIAKLVDRFTEPVLELVGTEESRTGKEVA